MSCKKCKKVRKGKLMRYVYDCPFCGDSEEVYTCQHLDEGEIEMACECCERAWVLKPKYFFEREST